MNFEKKMKKSNKVSSVQNKLLGSQLVDKLKTKKTEFVNPV